MGSKSTHGSSEQDPATTEMMRMVARRLTQWRPPAWEDDFSRNNLDDGPFHNGKPITQYSIDQFRNVNRLLNQKLLGGTPLKEFAEKDPFPIPSADDREGYLPDNDIMFWLSGLADYLKVMKAVRRLGLQPRSVYDFGCASGRVVRHFCTQSAAEEIWASDINQRHIRWLCEFMPPKLKPFFNHTFPSLPLADDSVDLICAFSVFTHIDTFETSWLAELRRVLRPGGVCYFTIHNEDTWTALRGVDDSNRLLKAMQQCENFQRKQLESEMPDTRLVYRFTQRGPYRSQVFHSSRYVQTVWGRFFDICKIMPRFHGRQSVVLMRRPDAMRMRSAA